MLHNQNYEYNTVWLISYTHNVTFLELPILEFI